MKKEMILPSSSVRSGQYAASRPSVFAAFKGYCLRSKAVHSFSAFYSRLLETCVTPLQTLHLLHAQMAFVLMVFPFPFSPFVRFFVLGLVCTDDGAMPSCGIEINGTVGGL